MISLVHEDTVDDHLELGQLEDTKKAVVDRSLSFDDSFNASYTEDLEPLDEETTVDCFKKNHRRATTPPRKPKRRPVRRVRSDPDHRWEMQGQQPQHPQEEEKEPEFRWEIMCSSSTSSTTTPKDDNDVPPSLPKRGSRRSSLERAVSVNVLPRNTAPVSPLMKRESRRSKFKRAASVDALKVTSTPRHSWDGGSRLKPKPDFRWDRFVEGDDEETEKKEDTNKINDENNDNEKEKKSEQKDDNEGNSNNNNKSPPLSPITRPKSPKARRRTPQRTQSASADFEKPVLTRQHSKVRFCLGNNDCIEVPRIRKSMKHDLFYTKKEIKVFKAEKKEEKKEKKEAKERRREEKERQQRKEQEEQEESPAVAAETAELVGAAAVDPPGATFAPASSTAIASAC